jgi:hypothetical protein
MQQYREQVNKVKAFAIESESFECKDITLVEKENSKLREQIKILVEGIKY